MNFLHSFFRKTRLVWVVGIPLFTLMFFLPYWFILCPLIWQQESHQVDSYVWKSPWLYGYWLVSACLWLLCLFAHIFCCKPINPTDINCTKSDEFLIRLYRSKSSPPLISTIPVRISSHKIQPRREIRGVCAASEQKAPYVALYSAQVEPPVKGLPPPPESDYVWDEDIPWLAGNRTSTFRSNQNNFTSRTAVDSGPVANIDMMDFHEIRVEEDFLTSTKAEDSEDMPSNLEMLSAEMPTGKIGGFYHLTPVGTPSSSSASPTPPPSTNLSVSTLAMDDFLKEIEFFNQVAQELKTGEESRIDEPTQN